MYFCGIRPSLTFFDRRAWRHVCNTRACTQKIYFHIFFEKDCLSLSVQEKISCFREKIPSFQIIQERSCAGAAPFGKTIFSEGLKKISYFRVFFKKDHLSFSVQRVRSYFREKEISSFPIIQERSYSSAIFLERPSFQDVWKKKIWFSVQCQQLIQYKKEALQIK